MFFLFRVYNLSPFRDYLIFFDVPMNQDLHHAPTTLSGLGSS